MEVQQFIHLVHDWLREHGLNKTCEALLAECGTVDTSSPLAFSLGQLFEGVSAFLNVCGRASLSASPKSPKPKAKAKPAALKRKASVSKDAAASENGSELVGEPTSSTNETEGIAKKDGKEKPASKPKKEKAAPKPKKEKAPPKPKKAPAVDGPWICPEMESILCEIFDRNELSAPPSATVTSPDTTEKKVEDASDVDGIVAKSTEGAMFSEDSDPDSEDETLPKSSTSKPITPASTPQKKARDAINDSLVEETLTTPALVVSEKKKKKKKNNFTALQSVPTNPVTPLEITGNGGKEFVVKKKKKKNVTEDEVVTEGLVVTAAEDNVIATSEPVTESKKKKKKKNTAAEEVVAEGSLVAAAEDILPTAEPVVTESKKKKKKKKTKVWPPEPIPMVSLDEEIPDNSEDGKKEDQTTKSVEVSSETTVTETVEEVSADDGKKKRKKRKRKSVSAVDLVVENGTTTATTETSEEMETTETETIETGAEDIPAVAVDAVTTTPIRKKSKKTKKLYTVEPFIDSPSRFGVVEQQTPLKDTKVDNKLALSTLGQSLKKKKKKTKNIGQ